MEQETGKNKPTIVMVPSPLILARTYEGLATCLRSIATVHVVGLPGTGSHASLKREWTTVEYARFLLAFLDGQRISKAVLIGHSSSGPIVAELARIAGHRVEALVLADTIGIRSQLFLKVAVARLWDAAMEPWMTVRLLSHFLWNFVAHSRNFILQLRLFDRQFKVIGHLSTLGVRTMLAWGQHDHTMPVQFARQLHLAGQGDLYISPTGSHDWVLTQPKEFTEALTAWLARGSD